MPTFRGVVIDSDAERTAENGLYYRSMTPSRQLLRWATILFDKIDWPTNRFISIGSGPDETFLQNAGVLIRSDVTNAIGQLRGNNFDEIFKGQLAAFKAHDAREAGCWTLAANEGSSPLRERELLENNGVLVGLYGVLPIPNRDVSLEDVLEFKGRRTDELTALRTDIERIYQQVIIAEDGPRAWQTELAALELAAANVLAVARESRFPWRLIDLKANVSVTASLAPFLASLAAGQTVQTAALAGISSGAATSISFGMSKSLRRSAVAGSPLQYLVSVHNDLMIDGRRG